MVAVLILLSFGLVGVLRVIVILSNREYALIFIAAVVIVFKEALMYIVHNLQKKV